MIEMKSSWGSSYRNLSMRARKKLLVKSRVNKINIKDCYADTATMSGIARTKIEDPYLTMGSGVCYPTKPSRSNSRPRFTVEPYYGAPHSYKMDTLTPENLSVLGYSPRPYCGTLYGMKYYQDPDNRQCLVQSNRFQHIKEYINYEDNLETITRKVQHLKKREKEYLESWDFRSENTEPLELEHPEPPAVRRVK